MPQGPEDQAKTDDGAPKGIEKPDQALMKIAYSGPAVLSNRFIVSVGSFGVRIAFAEENPPAVSAEFRTAVVVTHQDGILLYKLLRDLLADVEKVTEAATEKAVSQNG
jgi:hypothetical protein